MARKIDFEAQEWRARRLVWAVVAVGLCAGAVMLTAFAFSILRACSNQSTMNNLATSADRFFSNVNEVRAQSQRRTSALMAGRGSDLDATAFSSSLPSLDSLADETLRSADTSKEFDEFRAALESLKDCERQARQWRDRKSVVDNAAAPADERDDAALTRLQEYMERVVGRERLKRIGQARQVRAAGKDADPALLAKLATASVDNDSPSLAQKELDNLALLIERMQNAENLDALSDIKDNQFHPALARLRRQLPRLDKSFGGGVTSSSEQLNELVSAVFGEGARSDDEHQTIHLGRNGFFEICKARLELALQCTALQKRISTAMSSGDVARNSLARHIRANMQALAEKSTAGFEHAWWSTLAMAGICGVLFLALSFKTACILRSQFRELIAAGNILDAIPGVVFQLNASHIIVNLQAPADENDLLDSGPRMLGKTVEEAFPLDASRQILAGIEAAIRTGEVQTIEYCLVGHKGNNRDYEAQIAPMGTAGWLVLARDISDRKLLQCQLAQAQKLESIGQLAAGVAHEINTPIQYVGDNTRFLQDSFASVSQLLSDYGELLGAAHSDSLSPERLAAAEAKFHQSEVPYLIDEIPSAIGQSLEGIDRVATIVRAMKSFSHPDGDQKELTDLNHCIENTVLVARNEWKYVAEMVTDFDPQLPLVSCLPGEFNQVVLNLIVNAAHAIADAPARDPNQKGTIRISTRRIDDWVEIQVGDNGSGIPQAVRGRVFDPFFTTKEVGRGTGQGLAIAYAVIVEKHGGTITFETELGRGTTFIVRLPVGEPPAEQPLHEMEASLA
jgi:signal transduction histidine kinase